MAVLRRMVERARKLSTGIRARIRARREAEPTLPASAALIAIQHPSASLPERSYDLVLIAAVLALLGIGTVEIYAATAGEALTQFHSSSHFLERQILYVSLGGIALWYGARLD